jgi:hypothetical protein
MVHSYYALVYTRPWRQRGRREKKTTFGADTRTRESGGEQAPSADITRFSSCTFSKMGTSARIISASASAGGCWEMAASSRPSARSASSCSVHAAWLAIHDFSHPALCSQPDRHRKHKRKAEGTKGAPRKLPWNPRRPRLVSGRDRLGLCCTFVPPASSLASAPPSASGVERLMDDIKRISVIPRRRELSMRTKTIMFIGSFFHPNKISRLFMHVARGNISLSNLYMLNSQTYWGMKRVWFLLEKRNNDLSIFVSFDLADIWRGQNIPGRVVQEEKRLVSTFFRT